ncbi:MAG: accessory gene regulator B family protein [Eubacterium sp.]|nr:accessory gene regulator B family protein [Eubacterium sp.]
MSAFKDISPYLSREFQFSELEIARIRYVIISFISETSKLAILFTVFSLMNRRDELLAAIVVLLSIRNFTGGIHLSHYLSCLLFTFSFLLGAVALAELCFPPLWIQILCLTAGIFIIGIIGPVSSDRRPAPSRKKGNVFRIIACTVVLIYILLLLNVKYFPFRNILFWVSILQILQLVAAKLIKLKKERKQYHEKIHKNIPV